MTCFFRACHGKMPLHPICTSNELFFRVVSRENVIKSHVQVKLHVCLGACHGKMRYIQQITCFLGRVMEKCHICTSNYMFLGVCHGKCHLMPYRSNYVCFEACHGKMSLNSMYTSIDVYMEANDISPDKP